jgi:hypothetical protein
MKLLSAAFLWSALLWSACAAVHTFSFSGDLPGGGVIPDGNLAGWSDTRTVDWNAVGGAGNWSITDVNVSLVLSGGGTAISTRTWRTTAVLLCCSTAWDEPAMRRSAIAIRA